MKYSEPRNSLECRFKGHPWVGLRRFTVRELLNGIKQGGFQGKWSLDFIGI